MKETQQIFKTLTGAWKLDRIISGQGSVQGSAHFTEVSANKLHYKETGTLKTLNNNEYKIEREYYYIYDEKNKKITVYFANHTCYLLHELNFIPSNSETVPLAAGIHECGKDIYEAEYRFINDTQFKLTYTIKGPAKNYTIETLYLKII